MKKKGLEEQKRGTDLKPDEGFSYNPGKAGLASWQPDLIKYTLEEQALVQAALSREFLPAKTLREAEDWAVQNMGVSEIAYSGGRTWGGKIPRQADQLDKLNRLNEEWHRLVQEFPGLKKGAFFRLYVTQPPRGRAHIDRLGTSRPSLCTGRDLTESEIQALRRYEQRTGLKHSTERPEFRAVDGFRHELGHILTTQELLREWNHAVARMLGGRNRKRWFRDSVSNYAKTNAWEEVAECFCWVTRPDYVRGSLPEALEKIIHQMLGE